MSKEELTVKTKLKNGTWIFPKGDEQWFKEMNENLESLDKIKETKSLTINSETETLCVFDNKENKTLVIKQNFLTEIPYDTYEYTAYYIDVLINLETAKVFGYSSLEQAKYLIPHRSFITDIYYHHPYMLYNTNPKPQYIEDVIVEDTTYSVFRFPITRKSNDESVKDVELVLCFTTEFQNYNFLVYGNIEYSLCVIADALSTDQVIRLLGTSEDQHTFTVKYLRGENGSWVM